MSARTIVMVDTDFAGCKILSHSLVSKTQLIQNNPVGRFSSDFSFGLNQLTLLVVSSVCLMAGLYLREYKKKSLPQYHLFIL